MILLCQCPTPELNGPLSPLLQCAAQHTASQYSVVTQSTAYCGIAQQSTLCHTTAEQNACSTGHCEHSRTAYQSMTCSAAATPNCDLPHTSRHVAIACRMGNCSIMGMAGMVAMYNLRSQEHVSFLQVTSVFWGAYMNT